MPHRLTVTVGLLLCRAIAGAAQDVRVVDLPAATAKSAEAFGAIINVRELPQGKCS